MVVLLHITIIVAMCIMLFDSLQQSLSYPNPLGLRDLSNSIYVLTAGEAESNLCDLEQMCNNRNLNILLVTSKMC